MIKHYPLPKGSLTELKKLILMLLNDQRWKFRRVQLARYSIGHDPLEPRFACASRVLNVLAVGFKLDSRSRFLHSNTTNDGWLHTDWMELDNCTGIDRPEVDSFLTALERVGFIELHRDDLTLGIRLCPGRILDTLTLADRFLETDLEITGIPNLN